MARKKNMFLDEDYGADYDPGSAAAVSKLPNNVTGGATIIKEYMYIPVDKIREYTKKDGRDFAPWPAERFERLVDSVKELGVLEAVTVRVHPDDDELYEMLAGEHRWKAAIKAGLTSIPANVVRDCSDEKAKNIFIYTNLLRRELSLRDKVYGWAHYVRETRYKRQDEIDKLIESGLIPQELKTAEQSLRQIYRYAKLENLLEEILVAIENGKSTIMIGEALSYIPAEQQRDLLPYLGYIKNESVARHLRDLALGKIEGETWCEATLERIFNPSEDQAQGEEKKNLSFVMKSAKPIFKSRLNPTYYGDADRILDEALTMYFKEHPECEKPEKKKKEKKAEES